MRILLGSSFSAAFTSLETSLLMSIIWPGQTTSLRIVSMQSCTSDRLQGDASHTAGTAGTRQGRHRAGAHQVADVGVGHVDLRTPRHISVKHTALQAVRRRQQAQRRACAALQGRAR